MSNNLLIMNFKLRDMYNMSVSAHRALLNIFHLVLLLLGPRALKLLYVHGKLTDLKSYTD